MTHTSRLVGPSTAAAFSCNSDNALKALVVERALVAAALVARAFVVFVAIGAHRLLLLTAAVFRTVFAIAARPVADTRRAQHVHANAATAVAVFIAVFSQATSRTGTTAILVGLAVTLIAVPIHAAHRQAEVVHTAGPLGTITVRHTLLAKTLPIAHAASALGAIGHVQHPATPLLTTRNLTFAHGAVGSVETAEVVNK